METFILFEVAQNHARTYSKLKAWDFKRKKKLEKIMFADYLACTGRLEEACEVLESLRQG